MSEKIKALEYIDELVAIHNDPLLTLKTKYPLLRTLLEKVCKDLTSHETIQFADLFSRLAFICTMYHTSRNIHGLRVAANKLLHEDRIPSDEDYLYHISTFAKFISDTFDIVVPTDLLGNKKPIEEYKSLHNIKLQSARVSVVEVRDNLLVCQIDNSSVAADYKIPEDRLINVKFNEKEVNDEFKSPQDFWIGATLFLLDIGIDDNSVFHPKYLILEPDYLVDVSSISECLQDYGHSELFYFKSKFEAVANSKHILLGNFANLVVDEIFSNPKEPIAFNPTFFKHFKTNPFEYTTCTDIKSTPNFNEFQNNCLQHFTKIKEVIANDFPTLEIDIENASLEPSFISEKFGIQGRLDILDRRKKGESISKIIELKSGSTVFPDNFESIKDNHRSQLFLYYLLLSQVEDLELPKLAMYLQGFILYSKAHRGNIRIQAPFEKGFQEILELRNRIIILEHALAEDNLEKTKEIFALLNPNNLITHQIHPNFRIRIEPQLVQFLKPYLAVSELARDYFVSFVNYVAYEHYLSKLGSNEREKDNNNNGLAGLWLNSFEDKDKKFEIIYDLVIEDNKIDQSEQSITFKRTNALNKHANFRKGDICVLYPRNKETDILSKNQLFKCTIAAISKDFITVKFRYKQRNTAYFDEFGVNGKWALERDFMESSFNSMYRNLYEFLNAPKDFRDLILLQKEPTKTTDYGYKNKNISHEQEEVINKALSADNYFLLNGPPGTGKTSMVIKNLVKELMETEKEILVLAYTNRAVDELCEAINAASDNPEAINFIRFGSELSCNEVHQKNLLSSVIDAKEAELKANGKRLSRQEIERLLIDNKVYVSTVSSVSSKDQIFQIKDFDYIIVDEASQILEPQIIGTLSKGAKFILVGDHKQLPAISLQSSNRSLTGNKSLENIGLVNRKNSLFERLYKFCERNNFRHSIGDLSYQGRMHQEISLFPNFAFYGGKLIEAYHIPDLQESIKQVLSRQIVDLSFDDNNENSLRSLLARKRLVFFNNVQCHDYYAKFNDKEADLVVKIVQEILALYQVNGKHFNPKEAIGIIAPFRNHIAVIKQKLEEAGIPNHDEITVDSVERFQGSQRDIIIYSFSINNPFQLHGMVNLNDEGDVDRKLNVALTRAKEQLILIGNDSVLSNNLIYLRLIEYCKSKGGYIDFDVDKIIADEKFYFPSDINPDDEGDEIVLNDPFASAFDNIIISKIKADRRTEWPNKILGAERDFTRNNIICYGMANFDETLNLQHDQKFMYSGKLDELFLQYTPEDKVQLYCYWNMRKHYASTKHIFDSHKDYLLNQITNTSGRTTFIDFGCGPLTSALAFNNTFKEDIQNSIHYIGVDISKTMLKKAKEFAESNCFKFNDTFDFVTDFSEVNAAYFADSFTLPHTVILNFSYLLSNLDIEQISSLANQLETFIKKYPFNSYVLIFQNPVNRDQNFRKLLTKIKSINKSRVSKNTIVHYKNREQDWYAKNEHFMYEIHTN